MRVLPILGACAFLALGCANSARSNPIQSPEMVVTSYDSISSVTVVDLGGLPGGAQEQVYAASSRMSEDDLSALRQAVGEFPMALSALKAKELDASNVVVAVIDGHGRLLLVTSATI